jgi:hypothetical protein
LISVVYVSGSQAKIKQFASVIEYQMQLKSIKPSHCAFAHFGNVAENFIPFDAFVFADADFCTVNESYSRAFSETDGIEKKHHRYKNFVFYL